MTPFFHDGNTETLRTVARSWVGTPFHPHGRIKQVGCSCQTLTGRIYIECGFLPDAFTIPEGPIHWGNAQDKSLIEAFMDQRPDFTPAVSVQPGDLIGYTVGGCVHHLGIAIGIEFVHCMMVHGVRISRVDDATYLKRMARIWRPVTQE